MKHKSLKLQILFALVLIPALGWLWTQGQAAELPETESYSIYLPFVTTPVLTWEEVGVGSATGKGISETIDPSILPSLAVAPNETLYVAWQENNIIIYSEDIYVRHWNGEAWTEVGPSSASGGGISNSGGARNPSLAVAPDGTPYVAWSDISHGRPEIYIRRWDGNSWAEVGPGSASGGGISNDIGDSNLPSLAIGPDGIPYIAWGNHSVYGDFDIYVRRWDGNNWVEVGPGSASGGGISNVAHSYQPSMAIASDGTPFIAWGNTNIGEEEIVIYIRKWNGSEWVEVGSGSASGGGISNPGGWAKWPSLAIAPDGTPYVSWADVNWTAIDSTGIYIRRWNGTSWEEVGEGPMEFSGISSTPPSLKIASDGTPYVAWDEYKQDAFNYSEQIYICYWDGNHWVEVSAGSASNGGISHMPGYSGSPSLAIALDGTPYVTWDTLLPGAVFGSKEVFIRGFDGSSWLEVGEEAVSESGTSSIALDPSLAFTPDGLPYVAWENIETGEIYVRFWEFEVWVELGSESASGGGISNTPGISSHPVMANVPGATAYGPFGTLYVAWEENNNGNWEIYMRSWDGGFWNEVGTGSASDGGISNTPGQSQFPVLAATQEGILYLAWQDDSSGNEEIYIRQWDGSTWTEIGAGSATGGGVSNTSNASTHPALALSTAGVPYLAWEEEQAGNVDIYIRQWDGSNWVEVGTGSASEGGISNNAGASLNPALVVSPDGVMVVAWEDTSSGDSQIYVRQWDGSSWSEVGVGSASGGGISLIGASTAPSIGVSFTGVPMVSWSAAPAGLCCEIYVLQWNGTQWVEVGETSASYGGISNTSGISAHPVLAFAPNGNAFVVWEDDTSGNFEIYIRRYPLSPFPFE